MTCKLGTVGVGGDIIWMAERLTPATDGAMIPFLVTGVDAVLVSEVPGVDPARPFPNGINCIGFPDVVPLTFLFLLMVCEL